MNEETMQPQETQSLYFEVAPNVWGTKDVFVNMYIVRDETSDNWVLIDTGLRSSATRIRKMADKLFGAEARPAAILLTHGHFDHTGSLRQLADEWNVPVYCHYLELPYLSGRSSYPPPDASVNGGLMAKLAWLYPKKPMDISDRLNILPPDGSVPFLSGWRYLYTPGHAPGHVSFFRQKDRLLIAGDAVVTTIQESVMSVMTQKNKLSGPPKYFTYDWNAAKNSVMAISDLRPAIIASGHGKPMQGEQMMAALHNLARHFDETALPAHGRYVSEPAIVDAAGVRYLPPAERYVPWLLIGMGALTLSLVGLALVLLQKQRSRSAGWPMQDLHPLTDGS